MANSRCRTWSDCKVRALAFSLSVVLGCLWSVPSAEAAPRKSGRRVEAQQRREKAKKRKKKPRSGEPARDEAEPESEDGPRTESGAPVSIEEAYTDEEAAEDTSTGASGSSAKDTSTGERETIDLGDGASEKETIDLGESSGPEVIDLGSASTPTPVDTSEPEQLDFQLRGWARTRANQSWKQNPAVSPDKLGVPYEPTLGEQQLFLEFRYAKNRRFEAVASGLLAYTIARHDAQSVDGSVQVSARSLFEPTLREAYVGVYSTHVGARVGQQRIAWGNSDAFAINDVLNPRDMREPVLAENDVLHVPSVFARLDLTASWGGLQLLVAPFFRSNTFDVYGTNWALVQPDAPPALRGALGRLSNSTDPSLREPTQQLLRQTRSPKDDFTSPSAGGRFDWTARGLNVSHYYYYSYTPMPALTINPALFAQLNATDWTKVSNADLGPLLGSVGAHAISSTYKRNHHIGTSLQTGLGSFLLRAEGAYDTARVLTQTDLLAQLRPSVQGVLGVEYQPGDTGKAIIVEGLVQHILGQNPGQLLGARVTSYGAAAVLRWTFFEHLELELRAVASYAPRGALVRPQVAYKKDFWELRLGAVWLDGERGSQQHYFRRNQSAYVMAKFNF